MRDLIRHPITRAEQIAVLRTLIEEHSVRNQELVGDLKVLVLKTILNDLYRVTANEEGIPYE